MQNSNSHRWNIKYIILNLISISTVMAFYGYGQKHLTPEQYKYGLSFYRTSMLVAAPMMLLVWINTRHQIKDKTIIQENAGLEPNGKPGIADRRFMSTNVDDAKTEAIRISWVRVAGFGFLPLPAFFLLLGISYPSMTAGFYSVVTWALDSSRVRDTAISITAAGTFFAGTIFFYLRLHLRAVYGSIEAISGIAIAVDRIRHEDVTKSLDTAVYWTILTAGIYLIVRGFDNVHQYLLGKADDHVISWIRKRLTLDFFVEIAEKHAQESIERTLIKLAVLEENERSKPNSTK